MKRHAPIAILWQIGAPFDYNIHNAIMRENTDDFDEDVVCKVRFFDSLPYLNLHSLDCGTFHELLRCVNA